jgi:hypothetical protein
MSIKIEMHDGKWRMNIENETWQFDIKEDLLKVIGEIINLKNIYVKLNRQI